MTFARSRSTAICRWRRRAANPEHQRFRKTESAGTTLYLGGAEKFTGTGGTVTWRNYLAAGGSLIGMVVQTGTSALLTRYFHKDHLGSVAVITNETGAVVERLSFDAYANGADDPAGSITSQTNKGFTGHEELDPVGLVHMNGRVYDPVIARFGQADPVTESPSRRKAGIATRTSATARQLYRP